MKHATDNKVPWRRLGELISQCEERNSDLRFGINDVRGVTNAKGIIQTKASIDNRALDKFLVVGHHAFAFNRRVHDKLGLGFNESERAFIFTNDYVAFRVKNEKELDSTFLYIYFCRDEFDRAILYNAWGSATLFFNYEDMARVMIPVPSLSVQRKVVEVWRELRKLKEENEGLAEQLYALCRHTVETLKKKYRLAPLNELVVYPEERNEQLACRNVKGLTVYKKFIDTKADMSGVSLKNYKIVRAGDIGYVPTTNRNGDRIACGLAEDTCIVSSTYEVIRVKQQDKLLPAYLFMWFERSEMDRFARYHSWGSARETITRERLCSYKIPLPPIEVQQAIVDVYRCANEAKKIADEADRLSREICPALVRWAAEGGCE